MSYKICIRQFPQDDKKVTRIRQQTTTRTRRNFRKKDQLVTQQDVIKSHLTKLMKRKKSQQDLTDNLNHNVSLQCLNSKPKIISQRRKGQTTCLDQQSPVKQLFKDIFYHKSSSLPKGSYLSSPRINKPQKQQQSNQQNLKNIALQRTFYYRKIFQSPITFQKLGNTDRSDNICKQIISDDFSNLKEDDKSGLCSVRAKKPQSWSSTLNKIKNKLGKATKNKYKTCQMKINRIETESIASTRTFQRFYPKQHLSKFSAILDTQPSTLQFKKPIRKDRFLEELNPWSTNQIKLLDEGEHFNITDNS